MSDDGSTGLGNHLLLGLEAELVTARGELARAAEHSSEIETDLFLVAQRLTNKEAEHEAALKALAKCREDLYEARRGLEEARQGMEERQARVSALEARTAQLEGQRSFPERAVRKLLRTVKK